MAWSGVKPELPRDWRWDDIEEMNWNPLENYFFVAHSINNQSRIQSISHYTAQHMTQSHPPTIRLSIWIDTFNPSITSYSPEAAHSVSETAAQLRDCRRPVDSSASVAYSEHSTKLEEPIEIMDMIQINEQSFWSFTYQEWTDRGYVSQRSDLFEKSNRTDTGARYQRVKW